MAKIKMVDPFTGYVTECEPPVKLPHQDYNVIDKIGLELDKETGNTKVVSQGKRDLDKEIQEFKDDCGFEGMRKLIAQGRAQPQDFYDDGAHGQDVTGLPDNVNDAFRAVLADKNGSKNLFAELGIKPVFNDDGSINVSATEERLTAAVQAKVAATVAAVKDTKETEK